MLTAKEALEITSNNRLNKLKEEKERIYNAIKTVATNGLYKFIITIIYEETLEELKRIGYSIEAIDDYFNKYTIEWYPEPEEC